MASVIPALTAEQFHQKASAWLEQKEAENNLILGTLSNLLKKPEKDRQKHHFWLVERGGAPVGAAFWTPPYKFTLTEMDVEALQALANHIRDTHPQIPGAGGPKESVKRFSHFWNLKTQKSPLLEMSMRIYQLSQVEKVPLSPGSMQGAAEGDAELLTEWTRLLNRDSGLMDPVDEGKIVEGYIREQRLFLWNEGQPRAMAGYGRETPHSYSVNMVYTPVEFRNRGYATSLVSQLSQKILDSGKKYCLLYTDLLNPTSNGIYQKIGYQPVCDWLAYRFK